MCVTNYLLASNFFVKHARDMPALFNSFNKYLMRTYCILGIQRSNKQNG